MFVLWSRPPSPQNSSTPETPWQYLAVLSEPVALTRQPKSNIFSVACSFRVIYRNVYLTTINLSKHHVRKSIPETPYTLKVFVWRCCLSRWLSHNSQSHVHVFSWMQLPGYLPNCSLALLGLDTTTVQAIATYSTSRALL